jgi:hypothetical protein
MISAVTASLDAGDQRRRLRLAVVVASSTGCRGRIDTARNRRPR